MMHRRRTLSTVVAALGAAAFSMLAVLAGPAAAQREPSGGFPRERNPSAAPGTRPAAQPGRFDYYVLAMSWSPSYCATVPRDSDDPQCNRRDGKRYSFVLHGLWPQFERGWPQDCQTADRGFVPRPVAQRMLDIMPSQRLVFHQYRKHGTCSGLGVDAYFDLSRRLFESVKVPERFRNVTDPRLFVAPGDLMKEFLAANPTMPPDAIAVDCGGPGNRLKEVRVCFDRDGKFRGCGRNEDQRRLCSAPSMYVPPVREGTNPPGPRPAVPGTGHRI